MKFHITTHQMDMLEPTGDKEEAYQTIKSLAREIRAPVDDNEFLGIIAGMGFKLKDKLPAKPAATIAAAQKTVRPWKEALK